MNYKPIKGTIPFFKTNDTFIQKGCFKFCYKKGFFFPSHIELNYNQISSVEQVSAESVNTGAALGYGVVGGVLTGGVGLIIGAGLGAFNKKAYFRIIVDKSNLESHIISKLEKENTEIADRLVFIVEVPIKGMQKHLLEYLYEV